MATRRSARGGCLALALLQAASLLQLSAAKLPDGPLIMGYQDWGVCNQTATLRAAEQGLNVVIWFALNLVKDTASGKPVIQGGPDINCVTEVRKALEDKGLPTAHLISVGGWDAPHPDTSFSGSEWFAVWNEWNSALPLPFEGIDWDLEGNDDLDSPYNVLTPAVLNLVVDMSVAAKAAGFTVTLVPPQSYFDQTTSGFSTSLKLAYDDYHPEFHYRGRNSYAYIYAAAPPGTFDLVSIQLYESWSRAAQAVEQQGIPPAKYLQDLAAGLLSNWVVDFGNDPALRISGRHPIVLKPEQLVVALSFGWANGKSVLILPEDVGKAYLASPAATRPRGYAFWNIEMDGGPANGTQKVLHLTAGLNSFLHVRGGAPDIVV